MIVCDNAPQFKLAKKVLDLAWHQSVEGIEIQQYLAQKKIIWKMIPEHSPWQAGAVERMVGTVKRAMAPMIGRRMLSREDFDTLIVEVEAVVNSRPITYVHSQLDEFLVLRPADFLNPSAKFGTPTLGSLEMKLDEDYEPDGTDSKQRLLKFWTKSQAALDKFWRLWKELYYSELRERYRKNHPATRGALERVPEKGEIVLLEEESKSRADWKVARIVETKSSRDNEIRTARVQMPNGHILVRPINQLYPLEIRDENKKEVDVDVQDVEEATQEQTVEEISSADEEVPKECQQEKRLGTERYNLRDQPRKKKIFSFFIMGLVSALLTCSQLISARTNDSCALRCTSNGIAAAVGSNISKFLICCDFADCIREDDMKRKVFRLPPHLVKEKQSYECEIICYQRDEEELFIPVNSTGIMYGMTKEEPRKTEKTESNLWGLWALLAVSALLIVCSVFFIRRCTTGRARRPRSQRIDRRREEDASELNQMALQIPSSETAQSYITVPTLYPSTSQTGNLVEIKLHSQPKVEQKQQRNKAHQRKKLSPWLSKVISIIGLVTLVAACSGLPCIDFRPDKFSKVDSDDCVREGYVIYTEDATSQYCERRIRCPEGRHLKHNPSGDDCSEECRCPDWSLSQGGCSHYGGVEIINSTVYNDNTKFILEPLIVKACSVGVYRDQCDPTPFEQTLMRIELYDDTNYILTEGKASFELPKEPACIGHGELTGTPEFCTDHKSRKDGNMHCREQSNELLFLLIDDQTKIPIRSYGVIKINTYPYRKNETVLCEQCKLECAPRGIEYQIQNNVRVMELCIDETCNRISNPLTRASFPLELDMLEREHKATLSVWLNGRKIDGPAITCKAKNPCDLIDCWGCSDLFLRPQCVGTLTMILWGTAAYLIIVVLCACAKVLCIVGYAIRMVGWSLRGRSNSNITMEEKPHNNNTKTISQGGRIRE